MNRTILTLTSAVSTSCLLASIAFAHDPDAQPAPVPMDKPPTNVIKLDAKDTNRMPWQILEVPQINAKIPIQALHADEATGMMVLTVKYKAGFVNTWHTHPTGHGMYVLDGVLKTHQGEFSAGNFVWFPEGGWMEHGATKDHDVTVLFITNKKFGISYPADKDHPYPMYK